MRAKKSPALGKATLGGPLRFHVTTRGAAGVRMVLVANIDPDRQALNADRQRPVGLKLQ